MKKLSSLKKGIEDALGLVSKEQQFRNGEEMTMEEILTFADDTGCHMDDVLLFKIRSSQYAVVKRLPDGFFTAQVVYDVNTMSGLDYHRTYLEQVLDYERRL